MELIDKYNHKCWRYVSCDFMFKFLSARSPIYLGQVIRRKIQNSCFCCLETFFFFGPSKGIWNPGLWIPDSTNDWNPVPLIKNTESITWDPESVAGNPEFKTWIQLREAFFILNFSSRRVQTSNCRQTEFPRICLESFQIQV